MAAKKQDALPLPDLITAAAKDMIYISESEAPLDVQPWPDVKDTAALLQKIRGGLQEKAGDLQQVKEEDFLASIHSMADPADPVMMAYAKKYDALFGLLHKAAAEVVIIRAGAQPMHIYIAALGGAAPVILHTTAVET